MVGITAFGVMWLGPEHLSTQVSACEAPGAERGACLSAPREFRENCGIPEISWKSPEESAKLRSVARAVQYACSGLKFRKSKRKRSKSNSPSRNSLCRTSRFNCCELGRGCFDRHVTREAVGGMRWSVWSSRSGRAQLIQPPKPSSEGQYCATASFLCCKL